MINIIILFALLIGGIFLFTSDSQEENISTKSSQIKEKIIVEPIKKINILYLDDADTNTERIIRKAKNKTAEAKKTNYDHIDSMDSKEMIQYIEENNLVDITPRNTNNKEDNIPPRFSVYSDISEEDVKTTRDQNLPPMAPVISSGVFRSGQTYTVIIPALIKQNANKILVTDNAPDGTPQEAIKIPTQNDIDNQEESSQETQDAFTIAPPSIGQN